MSLYLSIDRSIDLSIYRSIDLSVYRTIELSIYRSIYLSIYLSVCLSVCLSACLFVCLTVSFKTQQFCETSSIFELENIKNETILRDLLMFRSWQHQKRSNSATARIPSKMERWVQSWQPRTIAFCDFPLHLSKALRLPRKVRPGHTKCCTCHAKSSSQNWRSDAPKCNPSQEISARTS